jgi:hypothetical protein
VDVARLRHKVREPLRLGANQDAHGVLVGADDLATQCPGRSLLLLAHVVLQCVAVHLVSDIK